MIRFLTDESCDFAVVRGLRAAGYDVVAISETARGAADLAVIAEAVAEERILISEDTGFGQLLRPAGLCARAHVQWRDSDPISGPRSRKPRQADVAAS